MGMRFTRRIPFFIPLDYGSKEENAKKKNAPYWGRIAYVDNARFVGTL